MCVCVCTDGCALVCVCAGMRERVLVHARGVRACVYAHLLDIES